MREYTASLAISHWDFTGCSSIPGIVAISSVSKSTGIFAQTILLSTFYILHSETWNSYPTDPTRPTDPSTHVSHCLGRCQGSHPNRNHHIALVPRRTNISTYPKAYKEATSSPAPVPVPVPVTVPTPAQSEQHSWRAWAGFVELGLGLGPHWSVTKLVVTQFGDANCTSHAIWVFRCAIDSVVSPSLAWPAQANNIIGS